MSKKKMADAYMTVEISIIFPFIVMILMCVFYVTFYSYNRTIAFQNAAVTALYGKYNNILEEDNRTEGMYKVLKILNKGQYMAVTNMKQSVTAEFGQLSVEQKGNVNIPILHWKIISKLDFSEKVTVGEYNPVFQIRQMRKVKNNET